jgi:uncharacterized HhH-GPD family protein
VLYVTRERAGRVELLVFDDESHPGMGTQLPAGRLDRDEQLEAGVARELEEETGLRDGRIVRLLAGPEEFDRLFGRSRYANHAFHVELDHETPDEWEHVVTGRGGDAGLVFRCRWVEIRPDLRLFTRRDPLLARLHSASTPQGGSIDEMATKTVERLYLTGDDEADALLAREPLALLIGFVLDQQVTMPKAFTGPLEIQRRLGTLDAATIAGLEPAELERVFRERPAIHRFPGSMAARVQELCRAIVSDYGGRAERVWEEAGNAAELRSRIAALPGFGEMKIKALASVLAKRFGVEAAEPLVPDHPTPGDIDSNEARERYQEAKRAHKARMRAERS